jgi:L-threonylcarbamoyladenylate synthase
MTPERVFWPADAEEQRLLVDRAIGLLRRGEAIVFPTDTVYGIAGYGEAGLDRLFAVKQRPREKTIAALVADPATIDRLAEGMTEAAARLVERYWPGPLTVVLRRRDDPEGTVGLRMPAHPIPLAIIRKLGVPLPTTSANLSGQPSPRTADDVLAQLSEGYPLLIDGGACPGGVDSTVIDLTGARPRLLRAGGLRLEQVEEILGPVERTA